MEAHASLEVMAAFTEAAHRTGDLVDNSLPHLQEPVRLSVVRLALERPGIDTGGELERLADGAATDEDLDPSIETEVVDAATQKLTGFLVDHASVAAVPAPVREIIILRPGAATEMASLAA